MKPIEERAKEFCEKFDGHHYFDLETGYINGATEQRDIDIQRACKIHCELCDSYNPIYVDGIIYVCDYCDKCKSKIKIEQAMKGE